MRGGAGNDRIFGSTYADIIDAGAGIDFVAGFGGDDEINGGADFDSLVKEQTDDSHPGIYGMTMSGGGDQSQKIYARSGMVPAFGNVGWKLAVGEVGVAPFSSGESPYGWHIIKRLE